MKRRLTIVAALVLMVGLVPIPGALADSHDGVYISTGDSLAAGTQADDGTVTDDAYTDVLFQRLRDDLGLGTHVKLGCPGESSTTFLNGDCPGEAAIGEYAGGSQLADVLAAIAAAGPNLRLITIDIGANDVLRCLQDFQGETTLEGCITNVALPTLAQNLTVILATLQFAAPGVPIVGMNYYNPNLAWVLDDANAPFSGFGLASQSLTVAVNTVLAATYAGAFGDGAVASVPVADVAAAFSTFDEKLQILEVCRLTLMCERDGAHLVMSDWDPGTPGPQPDIHPTDIGYQRIAWAFMQVIDEAGIG